MSFSIKDGQTYVFINWGNHDVLDFDGTHPDPGAVVMNNVPHLDDAPNQVWKAQKTSDGYFKLVTQIPSGPKKGCVLDLYGGVGPGIIGWTPNGGANQEWSFENASQGDDAPSFFIKSKATGTYVTVPGGNPANGVHLQGLPLDNSKQQTNWSRYVAMPFKM